MARQQQVLGNDGSHGDSLAVVPQLNPEPSVAHFNTVAEANQGKGHGTLPRVLAVVLGMVGQDAQDKDGKRFILRSLLGLQGDMVLLSVGNGTKTASQLLATPHMAALFHLGVQRKSCTYILIPVDAADFAAVKQIFEAIAAECKQE